MSQGIIYQLINKIDGTTYIGSTTLTMNKVWKQHIDSAMRMSPLLLHKEMRKYKNHNFMPKEICDCPESELKSKKEHYIKELNAYDVDTEVKEIIEETIISEPKKKKLIGYQNPENRGHNKPATIKIMGWNLDTGEERYWDSIKDAAMEVSGKNTGYTNIIRAMKHGYKAYGYRWKRVDNKGQKRPIKGIHKQTWQELYFESCADALRAANTKDNSGLYKALNSKGRLTWKGYTWRYI